MSDVVSAAPAPQVDPATPENFPAKTDRLRALLQSLTRQLFARSEDRLFLFLAILIGVFSGLSVVCFRVAIEWTQFAVLGSSLAPTAPRVFLAPAISGLVIAVLVIRVFPR